MKIVGNRVFEKFEGLDIDKSYNKVVLDLGCGKPVWIYKRAREEKDIFFIGIDAFGEDMFDTARKKNRERINNLFLLSANAKNKVDSLKEKIDDIYILYPWSDLLSDVINTNEQLFSNISFLLKEKGEITILVGYDDCEKGMIEKYNLPNLDLDFFQKTWSKEIKKYELNLLSVDIASDSDLNYFSTPWSKKLLNEKRRLIYLIKINK